MIRFTFFISVLFALLGCTKPNAETTQSKDSTAIQQPKPIAEPLISTIYTADPSAHVVF